MNWYVPLRLHLVPTPDSESFRAIPRGATGLPLPPHPGSFGFVRKNHVHEGIDLYCAPGTDVHAVESGVVVARINFTGPKAGSPWWHDTEALLVEGASGVVVYGEIDAGAMKVGDRVAAGEVLGQVIPVLTKDKGRPLTMLHLELHEAGTRDAFEWRVGEAKPASLRDPTALLLAARPLPPLPRRAPAPRI